MPRWFVLLVLSSSGCCGLGAAPMPSTPAASGTYRCSAGTSFVIDANGVLDNGDDLDCRTGVAGTRVELDCHGFRHSAAWEVQPDGSVKTDVIAVLYGEGPSALDSCTP